MDGALVIRDADSKPVEAVLVQMKDRLGKRTFAFPRGVHLCCVKRTLDTWLLADEEAIRSVCKTLHGKRGTRIKETLEDLVHPKEMLQRMLEDAKVNYSSEVLGEIAAHINLEQLETRVPSFKTFKQSVLEIWGH